MKKIKFGIMVAGAVMASVIGSTAYADLFVTPCEIHLVGPAHDQDGDALFIEGENLSTARGSHISVELCGVKLKGRVRIDHRDGDFHGRLEYPGWLNNDFNYCQLEVIQRVQGKKVECDMKGPIVPATLLITDGAAPSVTSTMISDFNSADPTLETITDQ